MKWDRTGEENNSGAGGKRGWNGRERERRTTVAERVENEMG